MFAKFINLLVAVTAIVALLIAANALRVTNDTIDQVDAIQTELQQTVAATQQELADMHVQLTDMQSELDAFGVPVTDEFYKEIENAIKTIDGYFLELSEIIASDNREYLDQQIENMQQLNTNN